MSDNKKYKKGDVVRVTSESGLVWKGVIAVEEGVLIGGWPTARTFTGALQTIFESDKVELLTGIDAAYPGCKVVNKTTKNVFEIVTMLGDYFYCIDERGGRYKYDYELYTDQPKEQPKYKLLSEAEVIENYGKLAWFWNEGKEDKCGVRFKICGCRTGTRKPYLSISNSWEHCSLNHPITGEVA